MSRAMPVVSRRQFIAAAGAASATATGCVTPARRTMQPNILFICTDDQAAWTLRALGNPQAHTPNLDRLFAQSVVLSNCFVVTPVCSPSRASTLTSRYGSEVGITDWIDPKKEPDLGLSTTFPTWPAALRNAGYQTALIGKWHLGTRDEFHPNRHGFDRFIGFRGGGVAPVDPELEVDGVASKHSGLCDEILTAYAIDQLREFDASTPFLMNVHYRWPHAPWQPIPEQDWAPYRNLDPAIPNPDFPELDIEKVKKNLREYLAACTGVDRLVGQLLSALDATGRADDTIVVFTSDNGYNMGHNGIWHKGNGHRITRDARNILNNDERITRPNIYDNSIRVPTAIRWPRLLAGGRTVTQTVSNLDWFPTLLTMAGIDTPANADLRGRNFYPLLRGAKIGWNNDLYAQYGQHHYTVADLHMYRTPEWKLVRDTLHPERDELYHLAKDPAERHNRIDDPSAADVRAHLDARLAESRAQLRQRGGGSA